LSTIPSETNRSNVSSGIEGGTEVVKRSSASVLVVDDFEKWRWVVRAALRARLGLHTFEEAADGLEAVQKAAQLQPDLVMLDIGLPELNGIEVARQIRSVSPESKVVFLTENCSCDLAEAALNSGAKGYVIKSAFAGELIPAVEAVLEGRQFLSAQFTALAMVPQTA
jgi:DNA-binding NarL/FixJ family response regulator